MKLFTLKLFSFWYIFYFRVIITSSGLSLSQFSSQIYKLSTVFDEAVNLTSELHNPNAWVNHLCKKKKEKDLAESTGVVPAEYPLKVKLELFLQL